LKYNPETEEVYCFGCKKWLSLRQDTYSVGGQRRCFKADHIVGYEWDLPEIFSNSHILGEENRE
jgi:hypothetical protein